MSWSLTYFLLFLMICVVLFAFTTLLVNDFEKKAKQFRALLEKRYNLEQLKSAYDEKLAQAQLAENKRKGKL